MRRQHGHDLAGQYVSGLTKKVEGVAANEPDVYYPNGCKHNYSRVIPADEIQGAVAANWSKQLGASKAYILDDTQLYGHGIAVFYQSTAQKIGLQVVGGPEGIDPQGVGLSRAGAEDPRHRAPTSSSRASSRPTTRASCGRTCATRSVPTSG